jgi:hypothetical protein
MKTILFILSSAILFAFISCNNASSPEAADNKNAKADSLEKAVIDVHDIVMPKSQKIPKVRTEINRIVDSIRKLSPSVRKAAAPYLAKLDSVDKNLSDAYDSMEKWMVSFGSKMEELNMDSTKEAAEKKIKYYSQEKVNIDAIKVGVMENLRKADSLLRTKF